MDDILKGKLTKEEAAAFLGISPGTLSNWLIKGHKQGRYLRHFKILNRIYFDRRDLERFRQNLIEVRAG